MAQDVFRITPRVSQVIRAIEQQLQRDHDAMHAEEDTTPSRIVFNAGDFQFIPSNRDLILVNVFGLEMAYTLPDDPEFALYHRTFGGFVLLKKHSEKRPGQKDFVYYTTERVEFDPIEVMDEAA